MKNELQPTNTSAVNAIAETPVCLVEQTGEKNVYAHNVENINITIPSSEPTLLKQNSILQLPNFSRTHYNLFVTNEVDVCGSKPFTIPHSCALTESIDADLKKEFSTLSDEAIAKIKSFPCIFANMNHQFGYTNEDQTFGFGSILQIQNTRQNIKIHPLIYCKIPQQRVNEACVNFDIHGHSSYNEFNSIHWSIKKIDLIAQLQALGFDIENAPQYLVNVE